MKKYTKIFIFIILSLLIITPNAYAEEKTTTASNTCTSKEKANLNKEAGMVKATYDVQSQVDGSYLFTMKIYNIVDDITIQVEATTTDPDTGDIDLTDELFGGPLLIPAANTDNGTYTFTSTDYSRPITYTISIMATGNCTGILKKITLIKPMKNKFHDYDECKYTSTEESKYCQEWINSEFGLLDSQVLEKIEKARSVAQTITTTKCTSCDNAVQTQAINERKRLIKMAIMAALALGVVINLYYIYIRIDSVRRSSL